LVTMQASLTPTASASGGATVLPSKTRAHRAAAIMILDHAIDNSMSSVEHRRAD
jgi:hypothetical protein